MKNKKIEKKVQFIFKRSDADLSREQMRRLRGGGDNDGLGGSDLSTLPNGCKTQNTVIPTGTND